MNVALFLLAAWASILAIVVIITTSDKD